MKEHSHNKHLDFQLNTEEMEHRTIETVDLNTDIENPYDEPNSEINRNLDAIADKLAAIDKRKLEDEIKAEEHS